MRVKPEKNVDLYTDGACSGNPGPGGYGVVLLYEKTRKELSGGYRWTTNNRMELRALVAGLTALKEPCFVTIHTDSKYLLGGFERGWVEKWKKNGWRTSSKSTVQNRDLWIRLDELLSLHHASFHWVKGHADTAENNRCDELAVQASKAEIQAIDNVYEEVNPIPKREMNEPCDI